MPRQMSTIKKNDEDDHSLNSYLKNLPEIEDITYEVPNLFGEDEIQEMLRQQTEMLN